MRLMIAAATLLLANSSVFAAGWGIGGKWSIHNSIAGNESEMICNFVQTQAKLTGSCKSSDSDKDTAITGSVDGGTISWKYETEHDGSTVTLTYTAKLSSADKFSGTVDVAPYGITGDFTATAPKNSDK